MVVYCYSDTVRPTDEMIALKRLFVTCSFQEKGATQGNSRIGEEAGVMGNHGQDPLLWFLQEGMDGISQAGLEWLV